MATIAQSNSTGSTYSVSSTSSTYSPSREVRRLKWGIFEVAYEVPTPWHRNKLNGVWRRLASACGLPVSPYIATAHPPRPDQDANEIEADWKGGMKATLRLLRLVFSFAPGACIHYLSCIAWNAVSPAVALYLAFFTLTLVSTGHHQSEMSIDLSIYSSRTPSKIPDFL